ncbi:MAG: DUF2853 family protein [Gemmatimonadaceae bacterium]|nr:DUF2853 family protein [Gemmatimonadaceae bacterium]
MSEYVEDVKKFASDVDEAAVASIVKYCGIALRNKDSSLVSTSDPAELERVKVGYAAKKLGLSAEDAEAGIQRVASRMKTERNKSRVTFYYLLAEETKTMDKLG